MDVVKLNNGVEMPILGYGLFKVEPKDAERCVRDAIDVGYRMIDTGLLTLARVAKEQGLVISGQQVLYGTGSTSAVPEYDAAAEAMTSRSLCLPLPVGQDRSISRSCRVNAGSRKPEL